MYSLSKRRKTNRRRGLVSLEWILIVTVLVIGIVGGLGAIRVAVNNELQDLSEAIEAINYKTEAECENEGVGEMGGCG